MELRDAGMGFFLFLLVNAALFIRPGEIIPGLEEYQIYLYLIVICLVVNGPKVIQLFQETPLREQPITVCVLGVGACVVLSLLAKLDLRAASTLGLEFFKVVLYYLLLVAVVDSPERLRRFLLWLVVLVVVLAGISVLGYHALVALPGASYVEEERLDAETGKMVVYHRLRGTGVFSDPNDLCLALAVGIVVCLYAAGNPRFGLFRLMSLLPLGLFGYTLKLTESRGGLVGILAGVAFMARARWGWQKTALFLGPAVPAVVLMFGGRMATLNIEGEGDTAQERIAQWAAGFECFRHSPLFGVGAGNYAEATGNELVAHNSFVHAYTELGIFGGTFFAGAFYFALWPFERLFAKGVKVLDPEAGRLYACVSASVGAYGAGLLSLSRNYVVPTYLVLGLAMVCLRQISLCPTAASVGLGRQFLWRLGLVGVAGVIMFYMAVRLLLNHG